MWTLMNDWSARDIQKWEYICQDFYRKTLLLLSPWLSSGCRTFLERNFNKICFLSTLKETPIFDINLEVAIQ
jgi:hypothetical protein